MSYDNLSNVSQNVLKFYQQLTGEDWLGNRGESLSFLVGTIMFWLWKYVGQMWGAGGIY